MDRRAGATVTGLESARVDLPGLPSGVTPRQARLTAAAIGAAAVIWFVLLSGWLGVAPGSMFVTHQNILFNADTNLWVQEMVDGHKPFTKAVHPLQAYLWRPPCQALKYLLQVVMPPDRAGMLAARLVVALVAGTGVGFLALLALRIGLGLAQCVLLFSMYLLFTSSSTIALPEHFGVSNGLLSIAFVVPILAVSSRVTTGALTSLMVLCGGTTITNVAYPLLALFRYRLESRRARRWAVAAAVVVAALIVVVYQDAHKEVHGSRPFLPQYVPGVERLYLKATMIDIYVGEYANWRLLRDPGGSAVYALYALAAPAVGPTPRVQRQKVGYEPFRTQPLQLRYYSGVPALGAALWMALLLYCGYQTLRDPRTRALAWLPIVWILFNMVLHNLWGDELMLYAPHWSWALMALVILGAARLSRTATALIVLPIVMCQVYTLVHIRSALVSIGVS
jgi:hypothetical protein